MKARFTLAKALQYVTLQEIEEECPCHGAYVAFLKVIKSNPSPKYAAMNKGAWDWNPTIFKNPIYSPTDHILLADIYKQPIVRGEDMSGPGRVDWLFGHLDKFQDSFYDLETAFDATKDVKLVALQAKIDSLDAALEEARTAYDKEDDTYFDSSLVIEELMQSLTIAAATKKTPTKKAKKVTPAKGRKGVKKATKRKR